VKPCLTAEVASHAYVTHKPNPVVTEPGTLSIGNKNGIATAFDQFLQFEPFLSAINCPHFLFSVVLCILIIPSPGSGLEKSNQMLNLVFDFYDSVRGNIFTN
jgi:hypothetical protein